MQYIGLTFSSLCHLKNTTEPYIPPFKPLLNNFEVTEVIGVYFLEHRFNRTSGHLFCFVFLFSGAPVMYQMPHYDLGIKM